MAIPLETKKLWAVFVIPPYEMWAAAPENKSFLRPSLLKVVGYKGRKKEVGERQCYGLDFLTPLIPGSQVIYSIPIALSYFFPKKVSSRKLFLGLPVQFVVLDNKSQVGVVGFLIAP